MFNKNNLSILFTILLILISPLAYSSQLITGGGGTPGGSDGQIQYNNGGSFGGASNFYYNNTTGDAGLGTSTPGSSYNAAATIFELVNTSGYGSGISLIPDTGKFAFIDFKDSTGTIKGNIAYDSTNNIFKINDFGTNTILNELAGGNVGIGTSTPAYKLDVSGSIKTSSTLGIGTNPSSTQPLLIRGNGGAYDIGITQNQVGGNSTMELTTTDSLGNQATRILIRGNTDTANIEFYSGARGSESPFVFFDSTNKNVGINTSTPDANSKLTLANSGLSRLLLYRTDAGTAGVSRNDGEIRFRSTNSASVASDISFIRAVYDDPDSSVEHGSLELWTRNGVSLQQSMRLHYDGSVGIGQSTPISGYKLVVANSGDLSRLMLYRTDAGTAGVSRNEASIAFRGTNSAGSPSDLGYIVSIYDDPDSAVQRASMKFVVRDGTLNEIMRLNYNGNVGIGTTTPNQKLEVNGGVRLNTTDTKPTCDSTTRGTLWFTQGGAGIADTLELCAKDATDTYAWRTLW